MPVSVNHILDALAMLGGEAHLDDIEQKVRNIAPPPAPASIGAIIRARLQEHCADAKSFKAGATDLFENVHGVAARRGVWRLRQQDPLSLLNADSVQDGADADIGTEEGRAHLRIHLRRERSRKLIADFKASLTSFACEACDFDFETAYGAIGIKYIEAHHKVPVAHLQEGARTRLEDLAALCANCHRIVHRNKLISVEELRGLLTARRKASKG